MVVEFGYPKQSPQEWPARGEPPELPRRATVRSKPALASADGRWLMWIEKTGLGLRVGVSSGDPAEAVKVAEGLRVLKLPEGRVDPFDRRVADVTVGYVPAGMLRYPILSHHMGGGGKTGTASASQVVTSG